MEKENLKEYLEMVIDLEKNIHLQEEVISDIEDKINGIWFYHPNRPTNRPYHPNRPAHPNPPAKNERDFKKLLLKLVAGIVGMCLGLAMTIIINRLGVAGEVLHRIITLVGGLVFFLSAGFTVLQIFYIAGELLFAVWEYIGGRIEYNKALQRYNEALRRYDEELRRYDEELQRYNEAEKQAEAINAERISEYQNQLGIMKNRKKESKAILSKLYSLNIIYPKYRNLPMLCSIYEYIDSGITDALEGKDGAYSILELNMRLDKLIIQMDTVISNLGRIQENQYMLYGVLIDANRKIDRLCMGTERLANEVLQVSQKMGESNSKLDEIRKQSEISAYNSERIAKELQYMNRMDYLTGKNDGAFFNLPPT